MSYLHPVSSYIFGITPSVLPPTVDLRSKCSPVSDQGALDSCVAFACIGAMEYLENLQNAHSAESFVSLSPQFVFYNERVLKGTVAKDTGTYMEDGLRILTKYGACELSLWPYNESNVYAQPTQAAYTDAAKRKALTYYEVPQTQNDLITKLAKGFPICFGFLSYSSFESDTVAQTGVISMPGPTETILGGHAMLIVGYDLPNQRFLCRNSWGPKWGIQGYCWMPLAYTLSPNLANSFYCVEEITWPTSPVASVTVPTAPACPPCPTTAFSMRKRT